MSALGRITRGSHIAYYSLMIFIAYAFKGQVHVFAGQVKIVSHSSCRTSAILKYVCPLTTMGSYCLHLFLIRISIHLKLYVIHAEIEKTLPPIICILTFFFLFILFKSKDVLLFVFLFDLILYVPVNYFIYVGTGLPALNQYEARINVSCSRTRTQ